MSLFTVATFLYLTVCCRNKRLDFWYSMLRHQRNTDTYESLCHLFVQGFGNWRIFNLPTDKFQFVCHYFTFPESWTSTLLPLKIWETHYMFGLYSYSFNAAWMKFIHSLLSQCTMDNWRAIFQWRNGNLSQHTWMSLPVIQCSAEIISVLKIAFT